MSVAAKSLCWWVLSVAHMLRTQKECDLRLSRIREGEERLANTNAYIRKWVAVGVFWLGVRKHWGP